MATNSAFPGCCAIQVIYDLDNFTLTRFEEIQAVVREVESDLYKNPTFIATTVSTQVEAIEVLKIAGFREISTVMSNIDRGRIITMWQRDPVLEEDPDEDYED